MKGVALTTSILPYANEAKNLLSRKSWTSKPKQHRRKINMAKYARQLWLLLWKNFVLQIRRPIGTAVEILIPVAMTAILIVARIGLKDRETTKCFSTFPGNELITTDRSAQSGTVLSPIVAACMPSANWTRPTDIFLLPKRPRNISKLAYYPVNSWTTKIAQRAAAVLNVEAVGNDTTGVPFTSESSAANEASAFYEQYYGAVIFEHGGSSMPKQVKYKIRLSHQLQASGSQSTRGTWRTSRIYPFFITPQPRGLGNPEYRTEFLPLQYALDKAIIELHSKQSHLTAATFTHQFPFPQYVTDPFIAAVQTLMPLLFTLAFIYTAVTVVKELVAEKQFRLKESMKMMGLANWIHWLAWFLKNFMFWTISCILLTVLTKAARIFEYTHWGVILVFFLFYSMSAIFFCFVISVFFSNAVRGMLFAAVLWFAAYAPYATFSNQATFESLSVSAKAAACLLPNTCLGIGVQIITKLEAAQTGVQWSTFTSPPTLDDNFSLAQVVLMMVVQCLVCWVLTWYIEAVFPGDYGVPRPFYFLFTPSYWCGVSSHDNSVHSDREIGMDEIASKEMNDAIEDDSSNNTIGVSIKNLRKVYSSAKGKKVAVDGLSLNIYEGQITALLGHNGAGKTTTMSILTGLFPPSDGSAHIAGKNIVTEMDQIRESLGLCPQHNVLFDRLTVREHLEFFIALKGISGSVAKEKINSMIADIQLVDKANAKSATLSGGMKRKLSCAIALIGDPEVVFLDEPTSGMDPSARRATWDLLQKHRGNKTMVLTTHFMDEADYLGDRIAIMADGQLRCCGSSFFLKKRYGVGYHMTIVKTPEFHENEVIGLIRNKIPTAKLVSNIGAEMAYVLEDDTSIYFKDLFSCLEEKQEALGVSSFGVSLTTLEEVFLKVGEGSDQTIDDALETHEDKNNEDISVLVDDQNDNNDVLTGFSLGFSHFKAMFIKRFLNSKRERKAVVTQILLPLLVTIGGLALARITPTQNEDPARVIDLSHLASSGKTTTGYIADFRVSRDSNLLNLAKEYYKRVKVTAEDIRVASLNIKNRNANNSVYAGGKSYPIGADFKGCCKSDHLVLNAKCIARFATYKDLCSGEKQFGYSKCTTCIENSRTSNTQNCPSSITCTPLANPLTYFTEEILVRSKGKKNFFNTHVAGITLKDGDNGTEVRSWFSNQAIHTIASAYSAVNNIILGYTMNDSSYGIQVTNHPLPRNAKEQVDVASTNFANFTLVIFLTMAVCFVAASFITFLVAEKSSKAKHVQFVSGVGSKSYWFATFCWDFLNFLVPAFGILILFAAFQLDGYKGEELGVLFFMLLLYGISVLPFIYCLSFLFSRPLIAYSVVSLLLMVVTLVMVIAVFICRIPDLGYTKEAEIMHYIFLLFPTYGFPQSVMDMATNAGSRAACKKSESLHKKCGQKWHESALAWSYPAVGITCLYMAIEFVVYFTLVILIEENFYLAGFFANRDEASPARNNDADVDQESKRIENMTEDQYKNEAVILKNLTKVYRGSSIVAVDHLSLGIPRRECFGLLGVNGAGKTTTFGMLTGELGISSGTAYLDGFNIQTHIREVQQRIGYCPQFDALVDKLTGREMLEMFARLRGIPQSRMLNVVDTAIKQLNLGKWADKMCGNYSGGNKRKLSTALALVGNPPIIFLDEPTSGMDPASRRFLWNTLNALLNEKKSIILTSHSMEECEALCTRLVIMVNGQFKCLGSIQHLKSRFGQGYTLTVKLGKKIGKDGIGNDLGRDSNENRDALFARRSESGEGDLNYAYAQSEQAESSNQLPDVRISNSNAINQTARPLTVSNVHLDLNTQLKTFVEQNMPGSFLMEERLGMLQYQIYNPELKWSTMFGLLEDNKESLNIADYSLSQTTLEQVFINFAKHQHTEDRNAVRRKCCGCTG